MSPLSADYLIVGAGVFGASTAFHLSQQEPSASIILTDQTTFPSPFGASHDINKIIRADYSDQFYYKLALEAQRSWRDDPIFKPYYHQTGMVILDDTGLGRRIIENHKRLGASCEAEIFKPEELKRRFGGIYHDTDLHGVEETFFNPLSGWAEATSALKRVIEVAVQRGVRYVTATVSRLVFDERGACIGVRATDGTVIHASKIILCTGAGTAKLLAESAPSRPELWVKHRLIAAGVCTAAVKLTDAQVQKFKHVPVLVHGVSSVLGTRPHAVRCCSHVSPVLTFIRGDNAAHPGQKTEILPRPQLHKLRPSHGIRPNHLRPFVYQRRNTLDKISQRSACASTGALWRYARDLRARSGRLGSR